MTAPRIASPLELKGICDALTTHYGARFFHDVDQWMDAGNTEYLLTIDDVIIRDGFISDGPGFCGSIAWVQFGGGPEYCCILSKPEESVEGVHDWTWNIVTLEA